MVRLVASTSTGESWWARSNRPSEAEFRPRWGTAANSFLV